MIEHGESPPATQLRPRLLIALCILVAVLLARIWIVLVAGSEVPFGDQWSGEARSVYEPFLTGTLTAGDLFKPHNEHRIAFTHLLNLALLALNGQWDPLVQLLANTSIPAVTAGLLAVYLLSAFRRVERIVLLFALLAIFCLPFGWENTLCGFQSCFYFSILLALGALGLIGLGHGRVGLMIAGLVCAAAGLLALGTSAAVGMALGFMGVISLRDPGGVRRGTLLALSGAAVFAIAIALKPVVASHDAYRAAGIAEFVSLFGATLAWPLLWHPAFFLIANAPLGILVAMRLLRRVAREPLQDAAILLGAWAAAVGAGFAFYRAGVNPGLLVVPSRYTDILCFLALANLLAILALLRRAGSVRRVVSMSAAGFWAVAMLSGFAEITSISWKRVIQPRIEGNALRVQMVTLFQRTGDRSLWERFPRSVHPSGGPEEIERAMAHPLLAASLPPGVHPGLAGALSGAPDGAFQAEAFPSGVPPPGFYEMRTSFAEGGRHRTGEFRSAPFEIASAGVELTIAGQLQSGGGSIELVRADNGASVLLLGAEEVVNGWITVRRQLESGTYSLVALSEREDSWLSFSAPRPVGPLSMAVREIRPFHRWFLAAAAGTGLIAILASVWSPAPRRGAAAQRAAHGL